MRSSNDPTPESMPFPNQKSLGFCRLPSVLSTRTTRPGLPELSTTSAVAIVMLQRTIAPKLPARSAIQSFAPTPSSRSSGSTTNSRMAARRLFQRRWPMPR